SPLSLHDALPIYRAYLATPVFPSMTLTVTGDLLQSGRVNELVVEGATPGARVLFGYSLIGGGHLIPGCSTQENVLQLEDPIVIGSVRADASGHAFIHRFLPRPARGEVVLMQALVVEECAISQLAVKTVR